jgi:hypothetical protein
VPLLLWLRPRRLKRAEAQKIIARQNLEIMRLRKEVERRSYALALIQAKLERKERQS